MIIPNRPLVAGNLDEIIIDITMPLSFYSTWLDIVSVYAAEENSKIYWTDLNFLRVKILNAQCLQTL